MSRNQKKEVTKISIFITSIFVIFLSVSYAFINLTITGTRRQVITAGNLDLVLDEDENNLLIENALPMYDEVGMLQEAFTFRLINRTDNPTKYILKLIDITTGNKLNLTDVKYGLTKDGNHTIDLLSNIQNNAIDKGIIEGNKIIEYELRLWIKNEVLDNDIIVDKNLSYRVEVEINQEIIEEEIPLGNAKDILFASNVQNSLCTTYNDNVDTFLVGQCSNNYVWYSGKLWRVVLKNNQTGAVKMITDNPVTAIYYNPEGNRNFANSYVDQWLNQEFLPTLHDSQNYLITDSVWNSTGYSSGYPKRPAETSITRRTVGLLNAYEYYVTYNQSGGRANKETNYLNKGLYWWLLTLYGTSKRVSAVKDDGDLNSYDTLYNYGIRPVVNLKSNVQIVSGDGTISNPFRLKGDKQKVTNGITLLSTRYSGDYINVNKELYRIVGIENGLTKIVSVDKPVALKSVKFHSSNTISNFASAEIKTNLENYYKGLADSTRELIEPNTVWYLGVMGSGKSYKQTICKTADANVSMSMCERIETKTVASIALPRAGEMFTSFITRKNKESFWTLTPYASSQPLYMYIDGQVGWNYATNTFGVRPSMYLKSNVVIASSNMGDGTYEHPYEVELGK